METGMYRGRVIVDMQAKALKKMERAQRKQQARGLEADSGQTSEAATPATS